MVRSITDQMSDCGPDLKQDPQFLAHLQRVRQAEAAFARRRTVMHNDEILVAWNDILSHPELPNVRPPFRATVINDAAHALLERFDAFGDQASLDGAISLWQHALADAPA